MALALVHANAETAEENVIRLPQRINETSSFMTQMLWAEMIDKIDVRADGRVLLAKLYGHIAQFLVCYSVQPRLAPCSRRLYIDC